MGAAEVIAFEEVRARKQWEALRQQRHARFDQWLDGLEEQFQESEPTLATVPETVWALRQAHTGSLTETIITPVHRGEHTRQQSRCRQWARLLNARGPVRRTGETLVGSVRLERPSFYCPACHGGFYPLDEVLGWSPGRIQLDVQQAAAKLVTEVPYDEAQRLFGDLTGVGLGSERMHTATKQVAAGLTVLDVTPTRDEIERRIAAVAAGRFRRPILVLGIDGADVPTRPASAQGRHPGQARQRARRARWRGQWREAQGFRFSLLAGERIVHLFSWHQVQTEEQLGAALQQRKAAGVIPEDKVRLCVVSDGAEWIWKHGQAVFPTARQVLDYYPCAQDIHHIATAHYGTALQGLEWVAATRTRLYLGKVSAVLGGRRRMQPTSDEAAQAITNGGAYLNEHRGRTHYRQLRRGGYPLGSGGIESSTKCICPGRLKRAGV